MAVQPLSPATHRRLGGPLPRQPANGPQAHPPALPQELSRPCIRRAVSCGIITCFHVLFPTGGQITHVLLTRPPLPPTRGWTFVRLACLRRAASVRSEPGSNSPSWSPAPKRRQLSIRFCLHLTNLGFLFPIYRCFVFRIDRSFQAPILFFSLFPFACREKNPRTSALPLDSSTFRLPSQARLPSASSRLPSDDSNTLHNYPEIEKGFSKDFFNFFKCF